MHGAGVGGWGRVQKEGLCEGEDGEAREAFPLAVEGQRRENGFERIIRAGKRGWERRRGVRGGGFTRPGSYCTDLSVLGLTDRELLQPCSQKVHVGALWASLCPINCPPLKTFAAGCLPHSCSERLHSSSPLGWTRIAFDVTPREEV